MSKLLASVAFAALMATSGSAFAFDLGVSTTAAKKCVVPGTDNTITYTFTVNGGGTIPAGGSTTLNTFTNVWCNTPATLSVTSARGALTTGGNAPTAPDAGGFTSHLNYKAKATWSTLAPEVDANNTAPAATASASNAAPVSPTSLVVSASTTGSTGIMLPGTYGDILTVLLSPI
jgi:hypothetical protein